MQSKIIQHMKVCAETFRVICGHINGRAVLRRG